MPAQGARRAQRRAPPSACAPLRRWRYSSLTLCCAQEAAPPGGELLASINKDFGSLDALVKKFSTAAVGVQGSGWAVRALRWRHLLGSSSLHFCGPRGPARLTH